MGLQLKREPEAKRLTFNDIPRGGFAEIITSASLDCIGHIVMRSSPPAKDRVIDLSRGNFWSLCGSGYTDTVGVELLPPGTLLEVTE